MDGGNSQVKASRSALTAVLDPFEVEDDWFALELIGYQVVVGAVEADSRAFGGQAGGVAAQILPDGGGSTRRRRSGGRTRTRIRTPGRPPPPGHGSYARAAGPPRPPVPADFLPRVAIGNPCLRICLQLYLFSHSVTEPATDYVRRFYAKADGNSSSGCGSSRCWAEPAPGGERARAIDRSRRAKAGP
jgi:hypothetical protein